MKIHDSNIVNLPEVKKAGSSPKKEPEVKSSGDVVDISPNAMDMQEAVERARNAADIRAEKVQLLRNEIEKGTYSVRGADVAEKVIKTVYEK